MDNAIGYYQKDIIRNTDKNNITVFTVVLASFWDANNHLDDLGEHDKHMPSGFHPLQNSTYKHDYTTDEDAVNALEDAGFASKDLSFTPQLNSKQLSDAKNEKLKYSFLLRNARLF